MGSILIANVVDRRIHGVNSLMRIPRTGGTYSLEYSMSVSRMFQVFIGLLEAASKVAMVWKRVCAEIVKVTSGFFHVYRND